MPDNKQGDAPIIDVIEYILCSAIHYVEQPTAHILPVNITKGIVICGHRHPHCIYTFIALTGKRSVQTECGKYTQGFLTNKNRFVDRTEAAEIAFKAKQIHKRIDYLFSEHIY